MTSLIEALDSRAIGRIEQTSPERITVRLDADAPLATALNSGSPVGFPRVNGYALIPNEKGAIACIVASVRTERLPSFDRSGKHGGELVQLPHAARLMELTPVGTLKTKIAGSDQSFSVHRGVDTYPSVGDLVLIPSAEQLAAVVAGEHQTDHGRMLKVGACPAAELAPVYVDPDKLFGRHLAILGNTGSGKSCSVASIVRSSLESARRYRKQKNRDGTPNARFIVLDPNGEYGSNFDDLGVRRFSVDSINGDQPLKVPGWLWNGKEWAAFADAAPGVQRPLLFDALRHLRNERPLPDRFKTKVWGRIKRYDKEIKLRVERGEHHQRGYKEGLATLLKNMGTDLMSLVNESDCASSDLSNLLSQLANRATKVEQHAQEPPNRRSGQQYHKDFTERDLEGLVEDLREIGDVVGLRTELAGVGEDCPRPFALEELPDCVEALAASREGRDMAAFVDPMNLRIRATFAQNRLASVVREDSSDQITLAEWLEAHIGEDQAAGGTVAVVDLSLVPSEVVHIVVSVLARMILEAAQRYRRHEGNNLPTTLVLEEAHTFVHRDLSGESAGVGAQACVNIFEKIAREGRKYGLGLVLASQRPSEIAPTVLSQCNTFLLHRLVNDRDQDLVRRLVPDGLGSLLRELPSLPTRRAMLLGWAAPAPVILEVEEVRQEHRPSSPDPDFWDVWTGEKERPIDWRKIAQEWQGE